MAESRRVVRHVLSGLFETGCFKTRPQGRVHSVGNGDGAVLPQAKKRRRNAVKRVGPEGTPLAAWRRPGRSCRDSVNNVAGILKLDRSQRAEAEFILQFAHPGQQQRPDRFFESRCR